MATRDATTTAPPRVGASVEGSHFCPIFDRNATAKECQANTRVDRQNDEFCRGTNCASPWRICGTCLAQGTVSSASTVVDRRTGLCRFHQKSGPAATRIRPLNFQEGQARPPDGDPLLRRFAGQTGPRAVAMAIRLKMKEEGMTAAEIAEEVGHPLAWVLEQLARISRRRPEAGPPPAATES